MILTSPADTPVMVPFSSTVATAGLLEVKTKSFNVVFPVASHLRVLFFDSQTYITLVFAVSSKYMLVT